MQNIDDVCVLEAAIVVIEKFANLNDGWVGDKSEGDNFNFGEDV
jgi:hypothetical protein